MITEPTIKLVPWGERRPCPWGCRFDLCDHPRGKVSEAELAKARRVIERAKREIAAEESRHEHQ